MSPDKWFLAAVGVTFTCLGVALFLVGQCHAYNELWTRNDPDLGRIYSVGSDYIPFSVQLAIREAFAGQWESPLFRLPLASLVLLVCGLITVSFRVSMEEG